jgi:hypothetical protein
MSYPYPIFVRLVSMAWTVLVLLLHTRCTDEEMTHVTPYEVMVRRGGPWRLTLNMLVGARSRDDAAALATALAARERGGVFVAERVRVALEAGELDAAAEVTR